MPAPLQRSVIWCGGAYCFFVALQLALSASGEIYIYLKMCFVVNCCFQWLETRPHNPACPVCKAAIDREKVVPLYGRGGGSQTDPRDKMPQRPQAQRQERQQNDGVSRNLEM